MTLSYLQDHGGQLPGPEVISSSIHSNPQVPTLGEDRICGEAAKEETESEILSKNLEEECVGELIMNVATNSTISYLNLLTPAHWDEWYHPQLHTLCLYCNKWNQN